MKREVKFRGKRIDTGMWVYGYYMMHEEVALCIASKEEAEKNRKAYIVMDGMSDWNLPRPIHTLEVIPESVGQFIGFETKDRKELYEGDIISKEGAYVLWSNSLGCWAFNFKDSPTEETPLYHGDNLFKAEVIGNIHDNPELLK